MKTVTLHLPNNIKVSAKEITMMLAAQLYDQGKLSLGQAADLIGLSKKQFMQRIGKYGVSVFGETLQDIASDLKHG
jgi:predicted HTH domain antitoxin